MKKEQLNGPKQRILASCVRMFIEKGYKETTMMDIIKDAKVSASTFQNLFHTKDGVLFVLMSFMFEHQFDVASSMAKKEMSPVTLYAIETAIQIALVEQQEHLREIYVEVYSNPKTVDFIHRKTTKKLQMIFSSYLPSWKENDFYEAEIGTAGLMRGYMARPCDMYFTLERKVKAFLSSSLAAYRVSEEEVSQVITLINGMNLPALSIEVMNHLFRQLEMAFDFKFEEE